MKTDPQIGPIDSQIFTVQIRPAPRFVLSLFLPEGYDDDDDDDDDVDNNNNNNN